MRFQCQFCQSIVAVENTDCGIEVQCGKCGEITTAPSSRVSSGVLIGNDFIILEEIGRGGMGIVYLSHQVSLDRPAALKILSSKYASNSEFIADFIKEARAAAKLNHPHIVQAYAVGEEEGIYFFAMEFIDGETMKAILKREKLVPVDKALITIQQIAEALDYAWKEQKLIHRDIKPDNIMITKNGRAKLADLGLARVATEIDDSEKDEVMGTPQYISPEHLTGRPMDFRSDIYSLGATFFHIITGRFPFCGNNAVEIARKQVEEPLEYPKNVNPAVPESACQIIMKMMEKNPEDRYKSAEELAEDLRLARRGKTPLAAYSRKAETFTPKKTVVEGGSSVYRKVPVAGGRTFTTTTKSMLKVTQSQTTSGKITTTTTGELKRLKEQKVRRQVYLTLAALVVFIFLVACFLIWKSNSAKREQRQRNKELAQQKRILQTQPGDSGVKHGTSGQQAGIPKEGERPQDTEYAKTARELLDFIYANNDKTQEIMNKCEEFFAKFREPSSAYEKAICERLKIIYIPLDEERIRSFRQEIVSKKMQELKRLEDEQKKKDAELLAKKREEERRKETERLQKTAQEREKKLMEEYKNELATRKESAVYRCVTDSGRKDFDSAKKYFDAMQDEESKVKDAQKSDAAAFTDWARTMSNAVNEAKKFWEKLYNSGNLLNGIKAELAIIVKNKYTGKNEQKNDFVTITEIKNGEITVRASSGNILKTPPMAELPMKQFKLLAKKLSLELGLQEGVFDYFLVSGEFADAQDFAVDEKARKLVSETAYLFIKQKLKQDPKEFKNLQSKYGKLDEFKKAVEDAKAQNPRQ